MVLETRPREEETVFHSASTDFVGLLIIRANCSQEVVHDIYQTTLARADKASVFKPSSRFAPLILTDRVGFEFE